jgi:hypothetical protein
VERRRAPPRCGSRGCRLDGAAVAKFTARNIQLRQNARSMLAMAVARRWPDVFSNALEPGWVPTKMGGPGAPDDMKQGHLTQAWLVAGNDPKADDTGKYFYHLKQMAPNPQAYDQALQDRLIEICAEISGVALPG